MRNKLSFLGLLALLTIDTNGQNLVPNPSFETPASCPSNNIFTAANWFSPNTASPDYFHPCGTGSTVPPNVLFGPQSARTGTCFAGAGWYGLGGGWYDYIQVQLSSALAASSVYSVSMWVSLADGVRRASDDFGIHISATPFKSNNTALPPGYSVIATTPAGSGVFNTLTPQIKVPTNGFITDTNNWILVSGTYTATGGEQAITIGCFEPWATTTTTVVNINGNDRCYYFIDDVSVELAGPPQIPSQPLAIAGSTNVCALTSQIFSVSPVGGATSYSWNLPSGWTGTSTTNTISVLSHTNTGTILVSAINLMGTSPSQSLQVNVANVQAPISLANSVYQTTASGTYQWVDCNSNYAVVSSGTNTFSPILSGNYAVIVNQNGCKDTSVCMNLIVLPLQPGAISGPANLCSNSTDDFSITAVANATAYIWILPSGWIGTSTTNTISITTNTSSGTMSVIAVNSAGQSPSQTVSINVNSIVATLTQTNGVLHAAPSGVYQWLNCSTSSVVSTIGSSYTPTLTGNYAVVINQNGCIDTSACMQLNVVPLQPGLISGTSVLCSGTSAIYSISPVLNATTYLWSLNSGWTGSSSTNSIQVTVNSAGGNLSVTAVSAGGQSAAQIFSITVNSANAIVTQTNEILYSNSASNYQWIDCAKNNSVVGTNNSYKPLQNGSYAVVVNQNGCSDTSSCVDFILSTVGLAEQVTELEFSVFPNPADKSLTVLTPKTNQDAFVIIYNYSGNTVYKSSLTNSETKHEISLENFSPGIYFVEVIYTAGKSRTKKITILR